LWPHGLGLSDSSNTKDELLRGPPLNVRSLGKVPGHTGRECQSERAKLMDEQL